LLGDGTTKIFLNASGTLNDVSKELKEFLNYIAGSKPAGKFTHKLENAVQKAKQNRKWRHEYMTLYMRDLENMETGMEKALISMVVRKIRKGKDIDTIAYELNEDKDRIGTIYYTALDFEPGYDIDQIYNALETIL
jgi:hypothetical protein